MNKVTRRDFIQACTTVAVASTGARAQSPTARIIGANGDVRIGIVGFHGHGKTHIRGYQGLPGVRIVACCDPDRNVLESGKQLIDSQVKLYTDLRELLDSPDIDAISGATPNHWHALSTVWACQAGKDVCVEKPVCHNIWEGRKMVEAARKYGRMVQADLDRRSDGARQQAYAYARDGHLGKILRAHGFVHKRRESMGKVSGPQTPPDHIDFDLWCGPSPKVLRRQNLHYDWHWQWDTGCGETGNNGPHVLDELRYGLGYDHLPRRVMSFGGRFGYDDDGETPNTQVAILDYEPAPIYFEVRGLPQRPGERKLDPNVFTAATGKAIALGRGGVTNNSIIVCEHGYVCEDSAFDNDGNLLKKFEGGDVAHHTEFIKAMRSRDIKTLRTDILEGHLSTALCHMANIAYRAGAEAKPGDLRDAVKGDTVAEGILERFSAHLEAHGVDLKEAHAQVGGWLEMDSAAERFVGGFKVERANELIRRTYREPYVIRDQV